MKTVPLGGRLAAGRMALVDDEDYELVSRYSWHVFLRRRPGRADNGPYALTNLPRGKPGPRTLRMHKLITGWPETDHKDGDGLNNQRSNLREATRIQNSRNHGPHVGGTSAYKGVSWNSQKRKWVAQIRFDGRQRNLGRFHDEIAAALTYDAAAREAFGEFAWLNFP